MDIVVLKQAQRELRDAPREFIEDIYSLFDDLAHGKSLGPPISKALSAIYKGLHELRLSGRSGEFRVFYIIRVGDAIFILHAHSKKTQKIEKKTIDLIHSRIKGMSL